MNDRFSQWKYWGAHLWLVVGLTIAAVLTFSQLSTLRRATNTTFSVGETSARTAPPEARKTSSILWPEEAAPRITTKRITDIKPGDFVLAYDEQSGAVSPKAVKHVFRRVSDHLRILKLQSADGQLYVIRTTNEHPFWIETIGWVAAKDVEPGQAVVQLNGRLGSVIGSELHTYPDGILVYNFEVEDSHTCFVSTSGAAPILVHNACVQIALGHSSVSAGAPQYRNLHTWAQQHGYLTYWNWQSRGLTTTNASTTNRAMFERAFNETLSKTHVIHFRLDGIADPVQAANIGRAGFASTSVPLTYAELHVIRSDPNLLGRTLFYRNGRVVQNPFNGRIPLPIKTP